MKTTLIILLTLFTLFSGCSSPIVNNISDVDQSRKQIVIATIKGSESRFKDEVIKDLIDEFNDTAQFHQITIRKPRDLDKVNADILIVMDQLKAWLWMNGTFKSIIRNADKDKTIFLMTAGDDKWHYKGEDVKIVTAASQKVTPDITSEAIISLIRKILPLDEHKEIAD